MFSVENFKLKLAIVKFYKNFIIITVKIKYLPILFSKCNMYREY